jgi:hypothetical protein
VNGQGTVYVVAALGGLPFGFFYGSHPAHLVNIGTELGSCFVDVNQDRLDFQFISANTEVLDHFTLLKKTPLRIAQMIKVQDTVTLRWTSVPGQSYRVCLQTSLDGPRRVIADRVQAQGDTTVWSGPVDPGNAMAFFSVSTELRITSLSVAQDEVRLRWASDPGQCYRVHMRDSLDGPWRMIADQIQAHSDTTSWSNHLDGAGSTGFFSVSTCSD